MSTAPAAGTFDQRVTLQRPAAALDALGQRQTAWTDVSTVYAQITPLRGREFFAAGAMQSEAAVRCRIRWRSDVAGDWRIAWRGVPHAIVAPPVDVDGARHTLELLCSAGIRDSR